MAHTSDDIIIFDDRMKVNFSGGIPSSLTNKLNKLSTHPFKKIKHLGVDILISLNKPLPENSNDNEIFDFVNKNIKGFIRSFYKNDVFEIVDSYDGEDLLTVTIESFHEKNTLFVYLDPNDKDDDWNETVQFLSLNTMTNDLIDI